MMFRLLLGFKDGAAEADFRRNFGYHRRKLDIQFFAVQCLVNSAYFRHTTSAWQVAWLLGASFIPAFIYLSISSASKQRWRTPIILGLKLCMIVYVGQVFKNDYYPVRKTHSWPVFIHNLGFACRALPFLGTHIGLQLPFAMDFPIMVLAVSGMAATRIQSQCWPGPLPEGMATVHAVNQPKMEILVDLLDWPFKLVPHDPAASTLQPAGVCVAIYSWLLLVFALGIPAMVLASAECRERARFIQAESRRIANERTQGLAPTHSRRDFPGTARGTAAELRNLNPRLCFAEDPFVMASMSVLAAAFLWCIIRTIVLVWTFG